MFALFWKNLAYYKEHSKLWEYFQFSSNILDWCTQQKDTAVLPSLIDTVIK